MKGEDILAIDRFYAVIPAYEPDEKMLAVIDDISSLTDFHIIVINDGSGKDKLPIFAEAAKKAIVLTHEVNKGKGRGIKTALEYIKEHEADTVGIVIADADGQHKVEDIIRVSEALKSLLWVVADFQERYRCEANSATISQNLFSHLPQE